MSLLPRQLLPRSASFNAIIRTHKRSRRSFTIFPHARSNPVGSYERQWMKDYIGWEWWTEELDKYETGVYYAVHLGDEFADGRYKVLHKLGNGSSSQVWLAKDRAPRGHGYVALKIVPAGSMSTELAILEHLSQCPHDDPGRKHVVRLLDSFSIGARNRSYHCLTFEIVGLDAFSALKAYGKFPRDIARKISTEVVVGLAYLHRSRIGHGDFHTKNICFAVKELQTLDESEMMKLLGPPDVRPVKRRDGQPLPPSIPNYTVKPSPFQQAEGEINIIDLGQAFHINNKPKAINAPNLVKAPELLLARSPSEWDYRIDLWSLGCLIYELFIGVPAFNHFTPEGLLWEMSHVIGELPQRWRFQVDLKKYRNPYEDYHPRPLEEKLRIEYEMQGGDMSPQDLDQLASLLRKLLVLEPEERALASDIVEHPWLRNIESRGDSL